MVATTLVLFAKRSTIARSNQQAKVVKRSRIQFSQLFAGYQKTVVADGMTNSVWS